MDNGNQALANILEPFAVLDWPEPLKYRAAAEIGVWWGANRVNRPNHEDFAYSTLDAVRYLLEDYDRQAHTCDVPQALTAENYLEQVTNPTNPVIAEIVSRMDRWLAHRPANRSAMDGPS